MGVLAEISNQILFLNLGYLLSAPVADTGCSDGSRYKVEVNSLLQHLTIVKKP
jgi:hypothetical protein